METKLELLTIEELVDLRRKEMATPNPEYQRGEVWNPDQQKKLIDSIMRGYQLPIIYLHYNETIAAGLKRQSYDIIDGQQRITALYRFVEGAFPLYKPDDPKARFPKFLRDKPCEWGGKDIHGFSDELKARLDETMIPVAYITTEETNEVRDLFVRLQSGLPLNAQEKRDSYPGQFTHFILALGGKPEITKYPGHGFFQNVLKMKPGNDRGKTRQLAAQIAILFLERRQLGSNHFAEINARAIDDYYYTNLDFNSESPDCKRLRSIFDKLNELLGNRRAPKLVAHNAIHLVLLLDSIWDDYTRSWESEFAQAQEKFSSELAKAVKANEGPAWSEYGIWTRAGSDRGDNIRRRHQYYSKRMHAFLGNLTSKDPKRAYESLEREIIFWRDVKKCRVCDAEVAWDEAEIHHVTPHSEGGKTDFENGVLVHRHCHPKTPSQVAELKKKIESND